MRQRDPTCPDTPIPRRVPEPFLRAEIAAFPLASEESFKSRLVELDPLFPDGSVTGLLWRECETRFAQHTGWSLDRLVAERDRGWFGPDPPADRAAVSLLRYLRTLTRSHLLPREGITQFDETNGLTALEASDHYRWLTFALPEDLLLSALGVDPAPVRVDLDPPLLVRRLLDLGVAEIHQHIGASMGFPLLWVSALAAIATQDVGETALASPGAPFSEGEHLVRWLLAAAITRSFLAEFLIRGGGDFRSFLDRTISFPNQDTAWTSYRSERLVEVLRAVSAADENFLPEIEHLRDLFADMHPSALTLKEYPVQDIDDAFRRCDPLAVRLDLHGQNAGERWFLRHGFDYLERGEALVANESQQRDEWFETLFWQTVRIRCQYYRTVVERPLTGGLQWFIRFYNRLGPLKDPLYHILPQVSYAIADERHRIRALEFRISFYDNAIEFGKGILDFLRSWQRVLVNCSPAQEPELGIVLHFIKQRDQRSQRGWRKGVPKAFWMGTFAEPDNDKSSGRYATFVAEQWGQAQALVDLIEAVPSCLWVIRGVDVANDELGVPTWVLAPIFRYVVDASVKASIQKHKDAGPELNVTAHVGEDFLHLLQGMRRIYEQVHYVLGGSKGRLGHAIALGIEPRAWAESVSSVLMPAEERLWDLVWEWRIYTQYRTIDGFTAMAPAGRVDFITNKVHELSKHIYNERFDIRDLADAHHLMHGCLISRYIKNESGYSSFLQSATNLKWKKEQERVQSLVKVKRCLDKHLMNEAVFRKGQSLIDVPVTMDEVEALNAVQYALRLGIARRGIVIEVNPSSNLLIGDLLDLRNHPILRLNPPVPDQDAPPSVAIALGSDDPLTFSSELVKEYVLLYQAACAAGYPERVVQEWIESIRRTGMDARFTETWRPSATAKTKKLIKDLCTFLHEVPEDFCG